MQCQREIACTHYNLDCYCWIYSPVLDQVENHSSQLLQHDDNWRGSSVATLMHISSSSNPIHYCMMSENSQALLQIVWETTVATDHECISAASEDMIAKLVRS